MSLYPAEPLTTIAPFVSRLPTSPATALDIDAPVGSRRRLVLAMALVTMLVEIAGITGSALHAPLDRSHPDPAVVPAGHGPGRRVRRAPARALHQPPRGGGLLDRHRGRAGRHRLDLRPLRAPRPVGGAGDGGAQRGAGLPACDPRGVGLRAPDGPGARGPRPHHQPRLGRRLVRAAPRSPGADVHGCGCAPLHRLRRARRRDRPPFGLHPPDGGRSRGEQPAHLPGLGRGRAQRREVHGPGLRARPPGGRLRPAPAPHPRRPRRHGRRPHRPGGHGDRSARRPTGLGHAGRWTHHRGRGSPGTEAVPGTGGGEGGGSEGVRPHHAPDALHLPAEGGGDRTGSSISCQNGGAGLAGSSPSSETGWGRAGPGTWNRPRRSRRARRRAWSSAGS